MNVYLTRRFIAPLALALSIVLGMACSGHTQTISDTLACGRSNTIDLGSVLAGATTHVTLQLINLDTAISDSIFVFGSSPTSHFSWNTADSLTLHTRQTTSVPITYSRIDTGWDTTALTLEPSNNSSCRSTYTLIAQSVGPSVDGAIIPLGHTSHTIVAFDTTGTLHIQLKNNTGNNITFDTLKLDTAKAFQLDLSSVTFPYTLARDSSFPLKLSFIANTPGFYADYVRVPNLPILPLSVQGLLQSKDAVQMHPTAATYIALYPNPSQGAVTIHTEGLTNVHVSVTDVLGRIEREASIQDDWQWDRQTEGGGIAATGTYFVIVTGVDAGGKAVHQIERIVLE